MPVYLPLLSKHCAEASEHIYNPTTPLNSNSLVKLWHSQNGQSASLQTVGIYASTDHHIVAFEGTIPPIFGGVGLLAVITNLRSIADWVDNAKARIANRAPFPGKIHKGFFTQFMSVKDELLEALATHSQDKKLVTTGHSQGGAISNLALWFLRKEAGLNVEAGYTFAAPNCGNQEFCQSISADVFRLEFGNDIVPHLPPVLDPPAALLMPFPDIKQKLSAKGYCKCGHLRYGGPGTPGHLVGHNEEQSIAPGRIHSALSSSKLWLTHHSMDLYKTIV